MPPGAAHDRALDHLYQGQSNDCYWHGLFGGVYLSHMRLATASHLIAAEDAADAAGRSAGLPVDGAIPCDLDLDGVDELLLRSPGQVLGIKPTEGGGIGTWDVRAVRHALTSVLRRRPEAYHAQLIALEAARRDAGGDQAGGADGAAPASIHDLVSVREPDLAARLHYDAYERRSGLVHLLPIGTTAEAFMAGSVAEPGDFLAGPYAVERLAPDETVLVCRGLSRRRRRCPTARGAQDHPDRRGPPRAQPGARRRGVQHGPQPAGSPAGRGVVVDDARVEAATRRRAIGSRARTGPSTRPAPPRASPRSKPATATSGSSSTPASTPSRPPGGHRSRRSPCRRRASSGCTRAAA